LSQPQARSFFFVCTDDARVRMSELYDFVWPAVTALAFARSKAWRYRKLEKEDRRNALAKAFQSGRARVCGALFADPLRIPPARVPGRGGFGRPFSSHALHYTKLI
jgi:hypothetical protein